MNPKRKAIIEALRPLVKRSTKPMVFLEAVHKIEAIPLSEIEEPIERATAVVNLVQDRFSRNETIYFALESVRLELKAIRKATGLER